MSSGRRSARSPPTFTSPATRRDTTAGQFLKFETATGQGAESVTAIREVLDAWNLTAADSGSIMDKLIVSHQKFGVSITDDEASLRALAPAMQASNMTVDDGIALLNLFATAGIDAAKAPVALAHAVKLLKPGQDINDLIAQIGAIQDPTMCAQEADGDLRGARRHPDGPGDQTRYEVPRGHHRAARRYH